MKKGLKVGLVILVILLIAVGVYYLIKPIDEELISQILQNSECSKYSANLTSLFYNNGFWQIELDVSGDYPICGAVCLVNITSKSAEIGWRCMGANSSCMEENQSCVVGNMSPNGEIRPNGCCSGLTCQDLDGNEIGICVK